MSSKNRPEQAADRFRAPWSLATRLTIWYAGLAFLLIVLSTGSLYWVLTTNLDREDDQHLIDRVRLIQALFKERSHGAGPRPQGPEWGWVVSQYAQFSTRIMEPDGKILLETRGMSELLPPELFPIPPPAQAEPTSGQEVDLPSGRAFRLVSAWIGVDLPNAPSLILQVALDRSYEEGLLGKYRWYLWLILALALLISIVAGRQITRRGLRPIEEITATARRVGSATLDKRLDAGQFPAELTILAGQFNEMLDRLAESFDRLSRFSADLAHELRTPLNNLRGEVEVALSKQRSSEEYRDVLSSCLEECQKLAHLIDVLLFLARAEHPETVIHLVPLDLCKELATIREFYEAAATEKGVELSVQASDGLIVQLDRTLLQRALANLLANALAHSKPGGLITLRAARENSGAVIEVIDTGDGIDAEHLPHVFDRFYRAEQARTTSSGRVGLGLAIVRSIALLHGGAVTIASKVGQGTRVRLEFPAPELN